MLQSILGCTPFSNLPFSPLHFCAIPVAAAEQVERVGIVAGVFQGQQTLSPVIGIDNQAVHQHDRFPMFHIRTLVADLLSCTPSLSPFVFHPKELEEKEE